MRAAALLVSALLLVALTAAMPAGDDAANGYPQDVARATVAPARDRCTPGAVWKQDCNYCRCREDGVSRVCTMVVCAPAPTPATSPGSQGSATPGRRGRKKLRNPQKPKELTESKELNEKKESRQPKEQKEPRQPKEQKEPRRPKKPKEPRKPKELKESRQPKERGGLRRGRGRKKPKGPCTPGSETTYQCNTCTCSSDGSGYVCTRSVCLPSDTCEPGKPFTHSDGCNTCTCPTSGLKAQAACTLRACIAAPPPSE